MPEQARELAAELRRNGEYLALLSRAARDLAAAADLPAILRSAVALVVPRLADRCQIDLVEHDAGVSRASTPAAAAGGVEGSEADVPGGAAVRAAGLEEVLRTGSMRRDHAGGSAAVILPLVARGATIGAMTVARQPGSPAFDDAEVEILDDMAAHVALAVDGARLHEQLQQSQQRNETALHEAELARHEAEQARQAGEEAQRALEAGSKARTQFLATMSHELRTPLNAIDGYAELLQMGIHGPITAEQREALTRLRRAQKRLLRLINDILNFANLEAGAVPVDCAPVRAADVLADLDVLVVPLLAEKGQTLAIEERVPGLQLFADVRRLEQILLNLLSNAIKFTPAGGHIGIRTAIDGAMGAIAVTDDGPGIPLERIGGIFEPFVQAQAGLVRDHGGVGLGLSISRELARRMNGELRVESRVGAGSTFTLLLPLAAVPAGPDAPAADQGPRPREAGAAPEPG